VETGIANLNPEPLPRVENREGRRKHADRKKKKDERE